MILGPRTKSFRSGCYQVSVLSANVNYHFGEKAVVNKHSSYENWLVDNTLPEKRFFPRTHTYLRL